MWAKLLIDSGKAVGRIPPVLDAMWQNLQTATNVEQTVAWANARSPEFVLDALAARHVPIFISNNFEDRLFMPDAALEYRQRVHAAGLQTYFMLNQGIHAQAEAAGAIGLPNVVFDRALEWLDLQLKGKAAELTVGGVEIETRARGLLGRSTRLAFDTWPPPQLTSVRYQLSSRGGGHSGGLIDQSVTGVTGVTGTGVTGVTGVADGARVDESVAQGAAAAAAATAPRTNADTIHFGELSGLSAGVPVVSETLQTLTRLPILAALPLIRSTYGAVYYSAPLTVSARVPMEPNKPAPGGPRPSATHRSQP